jgi:outer membrane protein TolC
MQKVCVIVSLAWLVAAPVAAQSPTPPATSAAEVVRHDSGPPLTLADAVGEALAHNPELRALGAQVRATEQRPAQARSLDAPMLETQIWQWPITSINPANTNAYMFMATQTLPGAGKRDLRAAVAARDVDAAELGLSVRAREIENLVTQSYVELFVARRAIDVYEASAGVLRQLADASQAKYAAGRISQQDVLKAVVELSKLQDELIGLRERADLAAARLNTTLARPVEAEIGPLSAPPTPTLPASVQDLFALALDHQPMIRANRVAVEHAEAERSVARAESKPDFVVQAGYMLMPHQSDAWMARFGISWPNAPWSRGKVDARVAEVAAEIDAAKAQQQATENAVRLAVQEAYIHANAARQRVTLLETTILPQSRQALEVSRIAYESDRIDFLSLLDNQRTVLGAELDYDRAVIDVARAFSDLQAAVGADLGWIPRLVPSSPVAGGVR